MLVIDTYNVLGTVGVLPPRLAGLEPDGLARLIGHSRWRRGRTLLVCDGSARPSGGGGVGRRFGGVELVYAGAGRDADSLIERIIESDSAPRRLVVVSSDRRVRAAARRRRARWLSSQSFLLQLVRDEALGWRPGPADDRRGGDIDVEGWVEEFGIDPGAFPVEPWPEESGGAGFPPAGGGGGELPGASAGRMPAPPAPPGTMRPPPGEPEDLSSDPTIREALEEWRGRLSLDDLDMRRWLGD